MKLDLSEIAQHIGMRSTQEINEPCFPDNEELQCVSPVHGSVEVTNSGTLLLVRGNLETDVRLPCGRCLTDVLMPIEVVIDEQFPLVHVGDAMFAVPEEVEDTASNLVNNNVLDLEELIRQNLLAGMPIQPLCAPECKGLCPTCGQNLNTEECTCPAETVESPFQVLAELLEEEEE
jgi:uncharacterized protein